MRRYAWCAFLAVALAATHAPAWAGTRRHGHGHEQEREGFWIGLGVGYGSAGVSADGVEGGSRDGGGTAHLRLGGTLSERVLLGCEINAWTRSFEEGRSTVGNVSAVLYYYPVASSGLFLKGGAGVGSATLEMRGVNRTARGAGPGLVLGVGYDHRIASNVSLTPQATLYAGWPGTLKADGDTALTGFKHNVFEIGLGITFH